MADPERQIDRPPGEGDPRVAAELLPQIYDELRRLAAMKMANEAPGQTLSATALVHEAYLRLVRAADASDPKWDSSGHFYVAAATAMRRILIENARRKKRLKHGGAMVRTDIDEAEIVLEGPAEDVLALHEALDKLAEKDKRKADLVQLRYFAGLKVEEAAAVLGISPATAERDWSFARAWLRREIARGSG